jgi:hypothetical protein
VGSGGVMIDGLMGDWQIVGDEGSAMPLRMDKFCKVYDMQDVVVNYEGEDFCDPWSVTGSSLKAYKADLDNTIVEFTLRYAVFFETEGFVQFKYRKDGVNHLGLDIPLGDVFTFKIDDEIILLDDSTEDLIDGDHYINDHWKEYSFGNPDPAN